MVIHLAKRIKGVLHAQSKREREAFARLCLGVFLAVCTVLHGPRVVAMWGAASFFSLFTENICNNMKNISKKSKFQPHFQNGVLLVCLLPAHTPLLLIGAGSAVGVVLAGQVFADYENYPFHQVSLSYVWLFTFFGQGLRGYTAPLGWLFGGGARPSGREYFLQLGGAPPFGHLQLLLGDYPTAVGSGLVLLALACGLCFWAKKQLDIGHLAAVFFGAAAVAFFFPRVQAGGLLSVFYEVVCSPLLFCGVFFPRQGRYVPQGKGRYAHGGILGALSILFAYMGQIPAGFCHGYLLLCPLVPAFERAFASKRRRDDVTRRLAKAQEAEQV